MELYAEGLLTRRYALHSEMWALRREHEELERQIAAAHEALRGINRNVDRLGRLSKAALRQTERWGVQIDLAKQRGSELARQLNAKRQELVKVETELRATYVSVGKAAMIQDFEGTDAAKKMASEVMADRPSHNFAYDLFISHATEDKDALVRPLAKMLRELKLRVWYDEEEIKIGDGIRTSIDHGLKNSRYGVLILSPIFIAKQKWIAYELDSLFYREIETGKVILPIWHGVSKQEVSEFNLKLAEKFALNTKFTRLDDIAIEIALAVLDQPKRVSQRTRLQLRPQAQRASLSSRSPMSRF